MAARRERRRQTLAGALLAGQTVTSVARRERISRSHLSRQANEPATRLLMAEFLAAHRERIEQLVDQALAVIADSFAAGKMGATKEGAAVDLGSDHFARLTGVKRLVEMIAAGSRADDQGERGDLITWETFLQLRAQVAQP